MTLVTASESGQPIKRVSPPRVRMPLQDAVLPFAVVVTDTQFRASRGSAFPSA